MVSHCRPTIREGRFGTAHTMFLVCLVEDGLVAQKFLDLGKEHLLLVVVVRLDELVPRQSIADKVLLVVFLHMWCLMINGIVAS